MSTSRSRATVLRPGAAGDIRAFSGKAPALGVHADARREGQRRWNVRRRSGGCSRVGDHGRHGGHPRGRVLVPRSDRHAIPAGGRVFLLGDAAHQMPPFLGQGMCAGIRDAQNLAWKLDLVRAGIAGEAIFDTYYEERAPHVEAIIERAVNAGLIIQTTDRSVAEARNRMFAEATPKDVRDRRGHGRGRA